MADIKGELKISVGRLELGMHVIRLDRPWEETDFLMQGFVIHNSDTIEALARQCEFVFIETTTHDTTEYKTDRRKQKQGLFARTSKRKTPTPNRAPTLSTEDPQSPPPESRKVTYTNKISTEAELPRARDSYSSAKTSVKNIMDGIRIGRAVDMNGAREVVDDIVEGLLRNKDALAWLTKIKNKDEYTAEHSLNVSILSATFARHLGHSEIDIKKIALGGLLHDVGKASIPDEILNKEGRFNDEEYEIMKRHTVLGRNLLMSVPNKDYSSIDIAHCHHERVDGRGYPRQLKAHQIPYFAKVVGLADAYDAITSSRCYDNARASMEALDIIYKCKGVQFDEKLALEFIKCIGIYPPGSIVELKGGEVGIVINSNDKNKLKPKVLLVLDNNKKLTQEKVVDLSKTLPEKTGLDIKRELTNGSFGIYLEEYIQRGLTIKRTTPSAPQQKTLQ